MVANYWILANFLQAFLNFQKVAWEYETYLQLQTFKGEKKRTQSELWENNTKSSFSHQVHPWTREQNCSQCVSTDGRSFWPICETRNFQLGSEDLIKCLVISIKIVAEDCDTYAIIYNKFLQSLCLNILTCERL